LGKAFLEASKQAVKSALLFHYDTLFFFNFFSVDAKNSPQGVLGNDVSGMSNANSSSLTDQLTRQHRMTLDEANLILNVKRDDSIEKILKVQCCSYYTIPQLFTFFFLCCQNYAHLFKANSPAAKQDNSPTVKQNPPAHSHYLQSKVFRARERIEAELNIKEAPAAAERIDLATSSPPSPPETPSRGKS
jgi:mitochondrial import inner membrane translocase subunit TIM16